MRPGRTPHWHLEIDMKAEELQQDMAKNEAKSRPLALFPNMSMLRKSQGPPADRRRRQQEAGLQGVAA